MITEFIALGVADTFVAMVQGEQVKAEQNAKLEAARAAAIEAEKQGVNV